MAEHHPGMVDAHKIKGAHPLKPLDGPRYLRDGNGNSPQEAKLELQRQATRLGYVGEKGRGLLGGDL